MVVVLQYDHTAICKAMEHGKTEVMTYLLDKLNDEDAEVFLKVTLSIFIKDI